MKLYNTLTNQKEEFIPIEKGKVKMYVCGPTVYNFFHIGNARPFLIFDAFRNYLEYRGYEVTYVQNFTDVDDKIINRANEENKKPHEVSEKYIQEYFKDADALGIKRATIHPKVTDHIQDIIEFVKTLEDKGYAYEVNGNVYYDATKFDDYGVLSCQKIDELVEGARVAANNEKKHSVDFALWKKKKAGEIAWDSPWGEGRPGWHIECSVMSHKHLGETIDIHAGGQDLIFPHHENEIAQSQAVTGKKFANYWIHNGYINIDNQKMSKSKGNFFTVRDILKDFDPEVIRFFMLSAHYRKPVNFSRDLIESAKSGLERIYNAKENLEFLIGKSSNEAEANLSDLYVYRDNFIQAMDDDINTADAIAAIFDLCKYVNVEFNSDSKLSELTYALKLLNELTNVLGVMTKVDDNIDAEIEELIQKRQQARKDKNYALADEIRDDLDARGIVLKDTPDGVKWSYKK